MSYLDTKNPNSAIPAEFTASFPRVGGGVAEAVLRGFYNSHAGACVLRFDPHRIDLSAAAGTLDQATDGITLRQTGGVHLDTCDFPSYIGDWASCVEGTRNTGHGVAVLFPDGSLVFDILAADIGDGAGALLLDELEFSWTTRKRQLATTATV
jgi:hypothetical protein